MKQWEKYLERITRKEKLMLVDGLSKIENGDTNTLQIKKMTNRKNTYRRKPSRNLRVEYTLINGVLAIVKI